MNQLLRPGKKQLIYTLVLMLTLGGLASLRNLQRDSQTGQLFFEPNVAKLCLVAVLSYVSCAIHFHRQQQDPGYARKRFLGISQPGRLIYLDALRVSATLMVICAHTIQAAITNLPTQAVAVPVLEAVAFLCFSCNLLFILVSGALLLQPSKDSVLQFYRKRFVKVAIPALLYFLCYTVLLNGSASLAVHNWKSLAEGLLFGSDSTPHFWFIRVIVLLYLLTPLLQKIPKLLGDRLPLPLFVLILLLCGYTGWSPIFFSLPGRLFPLLSWCGIFVLGYYLSRLESPRWQGFFTLSGLVGLVCSLFFILTGNPLKQFLYNYAPTMVLFSCAIFLWFRSCLKTVVYMPAPLQLISQYSFSVLLIHWYVLFYIVRDRLHLTGLSFYMAGGIILTVFTTLVLSLAFSMVFDNLVIVCLEEPCSPYQT